MLPFIQKAPAQREQPLGPVPVPVAGENAGRAAAAALMRQHASTPASDHRAGPEGQMKEAGQAFSPLATLSAMQHAGQVAEPPTPMTAEPLTYPQRMFRALRGPQPADSRPQQPTRRAGKLVPGRPLPHIVLSTVQVLPYLPPWVGVKRSDLGASCQADESIRSPDSVLPACM